MLLGVKTPKLLNISRRLKLLSSTITVYFINDVLSPTVRHPFSRIRHFLDTNKPSSRQDQAGLATQDYTPVWNIAASWACRIFRRIVGLAASWRCLPTHFPPRKMYKSWEGSSPGFHGNGGRWSCRNLMWHLNFNDSGRRSLPALYVSVVINPLAVDGLLFLRGRFHPARGGAVAWAQKKGSRLCHTFGD